MNNDRPMLARRQVRLSAEAALRTIPLVDVFTPGDWNTPLEKLPAIKVRVTHDSKSSVNKGMPEFNTTVMLEVEAGVESSTANAAQDDIEALGYAIEQALFLYGPLIVISQNIGSVDTSIEITSDGKKHLGGLKMSVAVELYEAFDPTATPPAEAPWPPAPDDIVAVESLDIHLDMAQPFDSSGTYTGTQFPQAVQAAPRTSGPDGRDEAALEFNLPQ